MECFDDRSLFPVAPHTIAANDGIVKNGIALYNLYYVIDTYKLYVYINHPIIY